MFRNVLYNPFYAFNPLKAAAPLTRTLKELAIFQAKKINKMRKSKKNKNSIETGA